MSKATRATAALDRAGVTYSVHAYTYDPDADRIGLQAAESLGVAPVTMLKTLMSSGQLNNAALGVTTGSAHLERKENANARSNRSRSAPACHATETTRFGQGEEAKPMTNTDEQIATILARYGMPAEGNVWRVEDQAFIYHSTLERIAAQAKISFDPPAVLRAERDEAVLVVVGRMGERAEWSIGEALVDVNYHVPGSEPAYVYAVAEKRARDRVILKLVELHDVISSEEPHAVESGRASANENTPAAELGPELRIVAELKRRLDSTTAVDAVVDLMLNAETQRVLEGLRPEWKEQVREYAKARMVALGSTPSRAA